MNEPFWSQALKLAFAMFLVAVLIAALIAALDFVSPEALP